MNHHHQSSKFLKILHSGRLPAISPPLELTFPPLELAFPPWNFFAPPGTFKAEIHALLS